MPQIKIDIEVATQKEHRRLNWAIRSARKTTMTDAVRDALMASLARPEEAIAVEIGIRAGTFPESAYIAPIVSFLRRGGWIRQDAAIIITPATRRGIFIHFDNR